MDEHLSPKLVRRLADIFPQSAHVQSLGLRGGKDRSLWEFARKEGLVVLTRDNDFEHLAMNLGGPPKVIIIRSKDGRTDVIEALLRKRVAAIQRFEASTEANLLVVE
ncbi:MAG TPA: DUF5615 family PIN-like protein [Planctomycetota bacterium]|nr:DUF5615 family PIN-like protein [Planctomycetota bacterium]